MGQDTNPSNRVPSLRSTAWIAHWCRTQSTEYGPSFTISNGMVSTLSGVMVSPIVTVSLGWKDKSAETKPIAPTTRLLAPNIHLSAERLDRGGAEAGIGVAWTAVLFFLLARPMFARPNVMYAAEPAGSAWGRGILQPMKLQKIACNHRLPKLLWVDVSISMSECCHVQDACGRSHDANGSVEARSGYMGSASGKSTPAFKSCTTSPSIKIVSARLLQGRSQNGARAPQI